jgi:transposase
VLDRAGARLRSLVADSQYSSARMRRLVEDAMIPYMSNQRRGEDVLRVDRRFRTHGPEEMVARYHRRPLVESTYSFLKDQYGLRLNNVRGLVNVGVYALLSVLCHVLNMEAAENVGRPDKAVSPRSSTPERWVMGLAAWGGQWAPCLILALGACRIGECSP